MHADQPTPKQAPGRTLAKWLFWWSLIILFFPVVTRLDTPRGHSRPTYIVFVQTSSGDISAAFPLEYTGNPLFSDDPPSAISPELADDLAPMHLCWPQDAEQFITLGLVSTPEAVTGLYWPTFIASWLVVSPAAPPEELDIPTEWREFEKVMKNAVVDACNCLLDQPRPERDGYWRLCDRILEADRTNEQFQIRPIIFILQHLLIATTVACFVYLWNTRERVLT